MRVDPDDAYARAKQLVAAVIDAATKDPTLLDEKRWVTLFLDLVDRGDDLLAYSALAAFEATKVADPRVVSRLEAALTTGKAAPLRVVAALKTQGSTTWKAIVAKRKASTKDPVEVRLLSLCK